MFKNCGCWYLLVVACGIALSLSFVQCETRTISDYDPDAGMSRFIYITKTSLCDLQQFFTAVK